MLILEKKLILEMKMLLEMMMLLLFGDNRKRKRSEAWKHFVIEVDKTGKSKIVCKHCKEGKYSAAGKSLRCFRGEIIQQQIYTFLKYGKYILVWKAQ